VNSSGSPAYCARDPYAVDETVWSLQPERFRTATTAPAVPSAESAAPPPDSAAPPPDSASPPVP